LVFPRERIPLHAMVSSAGHEQRATADYDWHGLRRGEQPMALFQYTLRGAGKLRVGEREWTVRAGDAMLLHFPADNRYWWSPEIAAAETRAAKVTTAWEFFYVCLHGREALRLWREVEARLGPLVALAQDAAPVECAARIVREALRGELSSAAVASAHAYELAARLLAVRPAAATTVSSPHRAGLARARALVERELAAPLGVAELARAAGLSRFHFSRVFAADTGQTPAAWLATRRVQAAAQLLREGALPLKDIAARCGFADVHTFGKVFRRHTGQPPAQYRRSGG
jgi:AraC family transcriptional regulator